MYNGAYMRILVNEFLSDSVLLQREVQQGDNLSPMLYIMCVEVLGCKIRSSSHIEGFLPPEPGGVQLRLSQYADDTTVFVKIMSSLYALLKTISL